MKEVIAKIILMCCLFCVQLSFGKKKTDISVADTIYLSSKKDNLTTILNQEGEKVVYLQNDGIYYIKNAIEIRSKIIIKGNGSTICPVLDWSNYNDNDSPLITFVGVKGGEISNVVFDFRGKSRTIINRVYMGVLLASASDILIEECVFKNGGIPGTEKAIPNSPYISIVSQDVVEDVSSSPKRYTNILGSSINNTIKNNRFLNLETETRFGIRVLTNWMSTRPFWEFQSTSSNNKILENEFEGNFIWNTIELAGGGTIKNTISGNIINGKAVNNIDIDKGASSNLVISNRIVNAGLPNRFKEDKNVRCSPISVQGMASKKYKGFSNKIIGNHIENVINPLSNNSKYVFSSGISLVCVDNTLVENNTLRNLYNDKNYRNGVDYGYGIVIHDDCNGVNIIKNKIDNVYVAIATNLKRDVNINLKIKENIITGVKGGVKLTRANNIPEINNLNSINKKK